MVDSEYVPTVTTLVILVGAVVAGPVFGLPAASSSSSCAVEAPLGSGAAAISVTALPDEAVLERSRFGAEQWRLSIDPARVDIESVTGRPTLTYKLRIDEENLQLAVGSTTMLSRCHDTSRITIAEHQFTPRTLEQDTYDGTIKLIYRGSSGGEDIERRVATKNVTVRVER